MRIVTEQIVSAFLAGHARKIGNTHTDGSAIYLHGNKIAEKRFADPRPPGASAWVIYITTAGWNTNTTKDRLRGLPGVSIVTKRGQLFLNGVKWDGNWIGV